MSHSNLAAEVPTSVNPSAQASSAEKFDTADFAMASIDRIESVLASDSERDERTNMSPKLSIVIPVYNERDTIVQVIQSVRKLVIDKQIIVVDDGSTDGTRDVLAALHDMPDVEVFFHSENQGKGAALQTGFRLAEGEIVIVQDADLEYNPEDILKVIAPIERGDTTIAFGSRYLEATHENSSMIHRLGNWGLTAFSNLMNGQKLTDMETCYKAFRRDVLQGMGIEQRRFGFEPEITAKVARRRLQIVEVPVRYNARSWGEGKKIGLRDLISAIYCIIRYRLFP